MISPVVSEEEWVRELAHHPRFEITANRIVLLSPHPDDETLGAGAFLASQRERGAEVIVIAVTDGENAYADCTGMARTRRLEQAAALRQLNIGEDSIHRLGLIDSGVEPQKNQIVNFLLPFATKDTCILAPWIGDFHPDHEACGWAAQQVAERTGVPLYWYFFWTWHRGTPETVRNLELRIFPVDNALLSIKWSALTCHQSQLHREDGEPILPDYLLDPAKRNFEVFALA